MYLRVIEYSEKITGVSCKSQLRTRRVCSDQCPLAESTAEIRMSEKDSAPAAAVAPAVAPKATAFVAPVSTTTRGVSPFSIVKSEAHELCMDRLETAITSHNHIKKVLDELDNLGCKLPKDFFVCRTCEFEMTGGFLLPTKGSKVYNPKIIMCEDKKIDKRMFQNTVLHELIHAYDICRAKMDWNNCKHYACTEIRASSLRSA